MERREGRGSSSGRYLRDQRRLRDAISPRVIAYLMRNEAAIAGRACRLITDKVDAERNGGWCGVGRELGKGETRVSQACKVHAVRVRCVLHSQRTPIKEQRSCVFFRKNPSRVCGGMRSIREDSHEERRRRKRRRGGEEKKRRREVEGEEEEETEARKEAEAGREAEAMEKETSCREQRVEERVEEVEKEGREEAMQQAEGTGGGGEGG